MTQSTLLFFDEISDQPVGGKAKGLAELVQLGFNVPAGFVITDAKTDVFPENLLIAYEKIGAGKVAVRSSALGEDAVDHSFAGQYETILNVEGEVNLKQAINDCIASLHSVHAEAYQTDQGEVLETTMSVVVQKMVEAKAAGVLFTVDPVSGRYDRLVIDAVEGLGEALVDGSTTPDHYELDESCWVTNTELAGEAQILATQTIKKLAEQARDGAEKFGKPLDMEWATDAKDTIFWLQARPITTIGLDLRELDTVVGKDDVLTRCNVAEIMPGATCPLTHSVQVAGFNHMLHELLNGCSGRKEEECLDNRDYMICSQGYIFINLSLQVDICKYSILASAENTALPICGRVIPELTEPKKSERKNFFRRLMGIRHFFSYIKSTRKTIADFAQAAQSFYLPYSTNIATMYENLDSNLHWIMEANKVHGHSSSRSGMYEAVLQNVISKGNKSPTADEQALAAKVMSGAKGVESALLVEQMDVLVDLIAEHPKAKEKFAEVEVEKAVKWLESKSAIGINKAYSAFLESHGHRGYRELDFMTPAWIDNPASLVQTMQASVQARFTDLGSTKAKAEFDISTQGRFIRYLEPKIHEAIRGREQTKSLLVRITHYLKRGYRYLGELMVKKNLLEKAEDIFFLTHEEIGSYIESENSSVKETIRLRKISYDFQEKLNFSDVVFGNPQPLEHITYILKNGEMQGRPVSKGIVEGVARVALTVEEAAALRPGEILIAPITDVAWTPYFSLISGLATDIGSAVSHGSVIAREYGLPCIVNLQAATSAFKTGDRVRLNAETGVLSKLKNNVDTPEVENVA